MQGAEPADCGFLELSGITAWHLSVHIERSPKKKLHDEAVRTSGIIDPLAELDIDVQSFDIPRLVSVYPDRFGIRWFTKAWFNNSESGEAAIEIERQIAVNFIRDLIGKDEWLEEYFPSQMEAYHNAINQTREQLLRQ